MPITFTLTHDPQNDSYNSFDIFVNINDEIVISCVELGFRSCISKEDWELIKSEIEPILYDDGE